MFLLHSRIFIIQVLSDHLVSTLDNDSAEGFRPPKPGKEAEWASWLPFPVVAVICESDAGLANAGGWVGGPPALSCLVLSFRVVYFGAIHTAVECVIFFNECQRGLARA